MSEEKLVDERSIPVEKRVGVLKITKDQKLNIINLTSGVNGKKLDEAIKEVTKRKKWTEVIEVSNDEDAV